MDGRNHRELSWCKNMSSGIEMRSERGFTYNKEFTGSRAEADHIRGGNVTHEMLFIVNFDYLLTGWWFHRVLK